MAKVELKKELSELHIDVIANKEEWKAAQENAFKVLCADLEVKGFRKGKVPTNIARKNISQQSILNNALNKMLDVMVKKAAKEINKKIMILDSPTYKVSKISNVELEVTFVYPVYPEFKISDYKKLGVKYSEEKMDAKKVDEEIEKIRESKSTLENKNGKIEKGDSVVFDFEGFVDNVPFEGGKAEKYTLEIGSGQFIPGFEEQVVGLKVGEEKELSVKFPEDYHMKKLKSKDAIFKVKIHEIKVKNIVEANDEFAKSIELVNVSNMEELKKYILDMLKQQAKQVARQKFQAKLFAKILESTKINLPESLVLTETKKQEQEFVEMLKKQGMTLEQYTKTTNQDKSKINENLKKQAINRLKKSLIFAEISKLEKIELTDEDYDKEYVKLAKVYSQKQEDIRSMITKQQMQVPMTNDRVIDLLIEFSK